MYLTFALPHPLVVETQLRALFEKLASELAGRVVALKEVSRRGEYDVNGNDACFVAQWSDGDVTWDASVLGADGNPRDGYGYTMAFTLKLPNEKVLRFSPFEWEPLPRRLELSCQCTGHEWLRLRALLRNELGAERDQSLTPYGAVRVADALLAEGDVAAALAVAREAFANVQPHEHSREALVAWLAKHDATAGGDAMQTREAPADVEGWLARERAGDSTLAPVFARLSPFDAKRWTTPAPWFAHPEWPFARGTPSDTEWKTVHLPANEVRMDLVAKASTALTGWESGRDWNNVEDRSLNDGVVVHPSGEAGWRWSVTRRARVPEGATWPVVHLTLLGVRREPGDWSLPLEKLVTRPFKDRVRWCWLGGPEDGDVLLIVERERERPAGHGLAASGVAYTVLGSETFRSKAAAVITELTRLRWYPVEIEASLAPHAFPPRRFDGPPFTALGLALQATLPSERLWTTMSLLSCRCAQTPMFCTHRLKLLEAARDEERAGVNQNRPRVEALYAAFELCGASPDLRAVERRLRAVDELLMVAAESAP